MRTNPRAKSILDHRMAVGGPLLTQSYNGSWRWYCSWHCSSAQAVMLVEAGHLSQEQEVRVYQGR